MSFAIVLRTDRFKLADNATRIGLGNFFPSVNLDLATVRLWLWPSSAESSWALAVHLSITAFLFGVV